jgi:type III secretion system YscQ/HrcQ family protein
MSSQNYPPYRAHVLGHDLALAIASLSSRFDAYSFDRDGVRGTVTFIPTPDSQKWRPVGSIGLEAGGFDWLLFLGSWGILDSQKAWRGTELDELPHELKLAASALFLKPWLAALEPVLSTPLTLTGSGPLEDVEAEAWADGLDFTLLLSAGRRDEAHESAYAPLKITSTTDGAWRWLAARLEKQPAKIRFPVENLRLTAAILAGEMSLPLAAVRDLGVGDILLPPSYPALDGRLLLKIQGRPAIALQWRGGMAQIVTNTLNCQETPVSDATNRVKPQDESPESPATPTTTIRENPILENITELRVDIGFELGRLSLSLKELSALGLGSLFPLEVEPDAPVTLTVNGQAVAQGRLVDLDGLLGVQVTQVAGGQ